MFVCLPPGPLRSRLIRRTDDVKSSSSNDSSDSSSSKGSSASGQADVADGGAVDVLGDVRVDAEDLGMATAALRTPHGVIQYFTYRPGKPFFVATCTCTGHGKRCRRTKGAFASSVASREGQGRPVAFLYLWLQSHMSQQQHAAYMKGTVDDVSARVSCREELLTLPGGKQFLQCERPRRPNEGVEPPTIP